jgi:hypothetical protein
MAGIVGRFSWFVPKGEPSREARVSKIAPITDEVTPTVPERVALAAARLQEDEALETVFNRLRSSALADFASSPPGFDGTIKREAAHHRIAAIDQIRDEIAGMADELKLHSTPVDTE